MKKGITIFILGFFLQGFSQSARALVDSTSIEIGNPAHFVIQVQKENLTDKISFPNLKDSLSPNLEILQVNFDTIEIDKVKTYQQIITFTSWEKGVHSIYPVKIAINQDTLQSKLTSISVTEPDATDEINDVKDIVFEPKTVLDWLKEYGIYMLLVLFILTLIGIILYLIFRKKNPKKTIKPETLTQQTLAKFDALAKKKLIEQEKVKEFYNEYSFLLKEYVEKRYHIASQVLLTSDLVAVLKSNRLISNEEHQTLNYLLQQSDLAKFAKIKPSLEDSQQHILQAKQFVQETQLQPLNTVKNG